MKRAFGAFVLSSAVALAGCGTETPRQEVASEQLKLPESFHKPHKFEEYDGVDPHQFDIYFLHNYAGKIPGYKVTIWEKRQGGSFYKTVVLEAESSNATPYFLRGRDEDVEREPTWDRIAIMPEKRGKEGVVSFRNGRQIWELSPRYFPPQIIELPPDYVAKALGLLDKAVTDVMNDSHRVPYSEQ